MDHNSSAVMKIVFMFTDGEGSKWVTGWEGNGTSFKSTRVVV